MLCNLIHYANLIFSNSQRLFELFPKHQLCNLKFSFYFHEMEGQMQLLMEIKLDISGTPCSNWSSDYASIIHPQTCGRYTSLIAFGNFLVVATCIAHVLIAHVIHEVMNIFIEFYQAENAIYLFLKFKFNIYAKMFLLLLKLERYDEFFQKKALNSCHDYLLWYHLCTAF
ncbi:hypothetical protein T05_10418 [Trichinella murrelli]|uniref:Uncharacterized protein n=1 Tax=Trichinella murrelli TaxID=144512 RepID=A0A0V0UFJ6_9BILA|nr:hypothetical protein T05_10418 [Trichinella murrelli]